MPNQHFLLVRTAAIKPPISGRSICWGIALYFLFSPLNSLTQENSNGAQTPIRDAGSVQILQETLDKMGGQEMWSQVHSAKVEGTAIGPPPKQIRWHFKWLDDWGTGTARFRYETNTGSELRVRTGDPTQGAFFQHGGNVEKMSTMEDIARVPIHLPAAILARDLNDPLSEILSERCPNADYPLDSCIRITRISKEGVHLARTEQYWFINSGNHLPDALQTYIYNRARPNSLAPRLVKYTHFSQVSHMLVPDRIEIPFGRDVETFAIDAPIFNTTVMSSDFAISR